MWGIVRKKVVGGIPAPILEHSMQRIMPTVSVFRDYSAATNEVTRGLLGRYGPTRVVDTPIAQTGFARPGVGSTYHGLWAFMTFKSSLQAADHIMNSSAKSEYVSAGAQGMDAANPNLEGGGWVPDSNQYRDSQKTIESAKRGIGGMLLDTDKAPIGVPFMPTGLKTIMPIGSQVCRVSKTTVTLGNKRYFGTVSESVPRKQSSQGEEKLNSPNHLRPLSPHLPIYKPQLNSTVSIFNRMSAAFLTTIFLSAYLICVKIGSIGFTFEPIYQLFFYSSKLILISAQITALALFYHFYQGLRHIFGRIK